MRRSSTKILRKLGELFHRSNLRRSSDASAARDTGSRPNTRFLDGAAVGEPDSLLRCQDPVAAAHREQPTTQGAEAIEIPQVDLRRFLIVARRALDCAMDESRGGSLLGPSL